MDDFEIVKLRDIHEILLPLVAPVLAPDGFEEAGILKWVRSVDAPIRQVFCFFQWKGGVFSPSWGLSLDFVPHVSGSRVKWHRSPKSAMLDLRIDSRDRALDITYHHGEMPIRRRAPQVVVAGVAPAREFWNRFRRTSDLLAAFAWVREYYHSPSGRAFYGFVQHPLALAFVYSMNGQSSEAMAELNNFLQFPDYTEEVHEKLRRLVSAAGAA